jgi:hypothetical protein
MGLPRKSRLESLRHCGQAFQPALYHTSVILHPKHCQLNLFGCFELTKSTDYVFFSYENNSDI